MEQSNWDLHCKMKGLIWIQIDRHLQEYFENVNFEEKKQTTKKHAHPAHKEILAQKLFRDGPRISRKGVHIYKGAGWLSLSSGPV